MKIKTTLYPNLIKDEKRGKERRGKDLNFYILYLKFYPLLTPFTI